MGSSERPGVLDLLHDSFRLQGGNEFTLPIDFQSVLDGDFPESFGEFQESENGQYYSGLLTSSIILLIITIVWLIALPCACCCKKTKCCTTACKNIFFFFALGCSIFGWFMSLKGNDLVQQGFNDGLESADTLSNNTDEMNSALQEILDSIPVIETNIVDIQDDCQDFSGSVDNLPDPNDLLILEEPKDLLAEFQDYLSTAQNVSSDQVDLVSDAYAKVTTLIIIFEVIFGATTLLALVFKDSDKGVCLNLNNCINCFGCILLFTLGLLFVLGTIAFCIIIAPFAILGADACTPSASSNFLSAIVENEPNPNLDFCELANAANVDTLSEIETAASFVCHYTQCRGTNIAFLLGGVSREPLAVDLLTELKAEIDDAQTDLNLAVGLGAPGAQQCLDTVTAAETVVLQLEAVGLDALNLIDCAEMTPILQQAVEESGCNGVVAGIGVIYITWTLGSIGLMAAMFTYATLDFERESSLNKGLTMEEANAYVNNNSKDNLSVPEARLVEDDGYNKQVSF